MSDEEHDDTGIPTLICAIALDASQEAKELIIHAAQRQLPDGDSQALCILTTIMMMMDSVCEASLEMAKNNPRHPLVSSPGRMIERTIAPKLAKLRELSRGA